MAEELGKIEKPEAEFFKGERKLYLVPLLFAGKDSPADFMERFDLYWRQVSEQMASQESKIGSVRRIYHESIAVGGEEGLKVMEMLNPSGHKIAQEKCEAGAIMEATELAELADECMDWERCLLMGFLSRGAHEKISQLYREISKQRNEYIAQRIDETLGANEVAILFIREGHMVQFPQDIQVFMVAPPALDSVHRWLRDRHSREEKAEGEQPEESESET